MAHAAFLRDACGDEATVRALAVATYGSTLSEHDSAVIAFATKAARDASAVRQG